MRAKEAVGCLLTVLALVLLLYELFYVNLTRGYVGVKGEVSVDTLLLAAGWLLILVGPWLWFGEVPVAIRRIVEIRTGGGPREAAKKEGGRV